MKLDKEADIEQRKKDVWWDIELFRMVEGRLPNKQSDTVTKMTAKRFLDRFWFGNEEYPDSYARLEHMAEFAFHVYASTNLAYEDDRPKKESK